MLNKRIKCAVNDARITLASIPIFAQQLCGEKNVTIKFDIMAETAMTDGSKITLPALPLPVREDQVDVCEQLADMVRVFIPHEVGHIRYSDFSVVRRVKSQLGRSLLNAIEDPRMELEMISHFPGTRRQMDVGLERLKSMGGWFEMLTAANEPAQVLTMYVLYYLRGHLRGQDSMLDLAEASRPAAVEVFGENFVDRLEVLLETDGMSMRSTADASALTTKILKVVKDEERKHQEESSKGAGEKPDEQQGEETGGGGGGGDQGNADGQGDSSGSEGGAKDASGDADPGSKGQGGGDSSQGQKDQADTGGSGSHSGVGSGAGDSPSNPFTRAIENGDQGCKDLGEVLSKAIEAKNKEASMKQVNEKLSDVVSSAMNESRSMAYEDPDPLDPQDGLIAARALKTRLRSHLQTRTLSRSHESVRGNRISPRKIHRTGQYDRRLFVHQDDQKGVETAVYLLADTSGSMAEHGRIAMLRPSLYAVADAMNSIQGVKVGAGIFPTNQTVIPMGSDPRGSLRRLNLRSGGATPMATSLAWAGRQMANRKEPRRILMILTDGTPAVHTYGAVRSTTAALEAMGIEVFAIGIQHDGVKELFEKNCVITDLEMLPVKMIEMLKQSLMKPLKRAA